MGKLFGKMELVDDKHAGILCLLSSWSLDFLEWGFAFWVLLCSDENSYFIRLFLAGFSIGYLFFVLP